MTEPMENALAGRAKRKELEVLEVLDAAKAGTKAAKAKLAPSVLDGLREALLGGETHYTDRPGIEALRQALGSRIGRSPVDVVITSGLREALFVSLLALERRDVPVSLSPRTSVHESLCRILGIPLAPSTPTDGPVVSVRRAGEPKAIAESLFELVLLDDSWVDRASNEALSMDIDTDSASSLILGTLDSLPGVSSFRVGFTSAPPTISPRLRRWKQALSICTSAPSQRAALLALALSDPKAQ